MSTNVCGDKIALKLKTKIVPKYGQINCEKVNCHNKAYYELDSHYVYGVHKHHKPNRIELTKMSPSKLAQQKKELHAIDLKFIALAQKENIQLGRVGQVIVTQLKMMKEPKPQRIFKSISML